MSIKSSTAVALSKLIKAQTQHWASKPIATQQKVLKKLIDGGRQTAFGKDHQFEAIQSYEDFKHRVPVRDYEALKPYIERILQGEKNVLWKGVPLYFAKTSGTTSGAKYIPLTRESMPHHIQSARNALLHYLAETGNKSFVDGKMIFLQGSPVLQDHNGIQIGRLSGIVAHYVPKYLQKNRLPSWETNCIEDWETKVNRIVEETYQQNLTLISGIPPWVQMYFEKLIEKTGRPIGEIFPNFSLFVYGGVNYEPYRNTFEKLIGRPVHSIEMYPASEGFFAYQDTQKEKGMLLLLQSGIFYEFIPAAECFSENPPRLSLAEVDLGVNYVLIISTNAGLWAYNTGDTVQFTSLDPYRVVVTGRIKHFISAFGEHVIGSEVEQALKKGIENFPEVSVYEFTVAPNVTPYEGGLPYHQWLIEFENPPHDLAAFSQTIDQALQNLNPYYLDLIQGKVLQPLKISVLPKGSFTAYMKSEGKLGGQNKLPRLSNDRKIADAVLKF